MHGNSFHSHQDFMGFSEIEWRGSKYARIRKSFVLNLGIKKCRFIIMMLSLKVPTANGIQYCFKVGDHA